MPIPDNPTLRLSDEQKELLEARAERRAKLEAAAAQRLETMTEDELLSANIKSEKAMRGQKELDHVHVTFPRGMNQLLRSAGLRAGARAVDVVRQAVCDRLGLQALPFEIELKAFSEITTRAEADQAIRQLQATDAANIYKTRLADEGIAPISREYELSITDQDSAILITVLSRIVTRLARARHKDGMTISMLTGYEIHSLRLALANALPKPEEKNKKSRKTSVSSV